MSTTVFLKCKEMNMVVRVSRRRRYLISDLKGMNDRHTYLDEENSREEEDPVQVRGGGHVPGMAEGQQGGQDGFRGVSEQERRRGKPRADGQVVLDH